MLIFDVVLHKQPEVIRELVLEDLLPVSVLTEKRMPELPASEKEQAPGPIDGNDGVSKFYRDLMRHDAYKRIRGAIRQIRRA